MERSPAPDISGLKDIREGERDAFKGPADYIRQVEGRFLCRYGDIVIESVFSEDGFTIEDRIGQYLRMS